MDQHAGIPSFDPHRVRTEDMIVAMRVVGNDLLRRDDADADDFVRASAIFEAADRLEEMLTAGGNLTRALCWAGSPQAGVEGPPDQMLPGVIPEWFRVNGRELPEFFGLKVFRWAKD